MMLTMIQNGLYCMYFASDLPYAQLVPIYDLCSQVLFSHQEWLDIEIGTFLFARLIPRC